MKLKSEVTELQLEDSNVVGVNLTDSTLQQQQQQQQPFNGRLSGTTRVGRYQKKLHPLTPILVNVLPLSPFSICNGPRHPLYSGQAISLILASLSRYKQHFIEGNLSSYEKSDPVCFKAIY